MLLNLFSGSNWEDTIYNLTVASLKFEFLMTNHRNMVRLTKVTENKRKTCILILSLRKKNEVSTLVEISVV